MGSWGRWWESPSPAPQPTLPPSLLPLLWKSLAEESPPLPTPTWLEVIRTRDASGVRLQVTFPSLHVHLTDWIVAGRIPSPAPVFVRVSRGEATLRSATVQPVPEGDGYLYIAAFSLAGYGYCVDPFLPGDVVWVVQGSTVLSLTVPPLSAQADPDAEVISGTAPPSDTLALLPLPPAPPLSRS